MKMCLLLYAQHTGKSAVVFCLILPTPGMCVCVFFGYKGMHINVRL